MEQAITLEMIANEVLRGIKEEFHKLQKLPGKGNKISWIACPITDFLFQRPIDYFIQRYIETASCNAAEFLLERGVIDLDEQRENVANIPGVDSAYQSDEETGLEVLVTCGEAPPTHYKFKEGDKLMVFYYGWREPFEVMAAQ